MISSYISIRLLAQAFGSFENLLKGLFTQGGAWEREKRKRTHCLVVVLFWAGSCQGQNTYRTLEPKDG